jgi:hypothetical protein
MAFSFKLGGRERLRTFWKVLVGLILGDTLVLELVLKDLGRNG